MALLHHMPEYVEGRPRHGEGLGRRCGQKHLEVCTHADQRASPEATAPDTLIGDGAEKCRSADRRCFSDVRV
jgi:hypothetical protein